MLSVNSGPKLAVGQCEKVDRFAWGELAVGRNFACLSYHSCHIFGTWRSREGTRPFSWGSGPLKKICKDFNVAIRGGLCWIKWSTNGEGKGVISHSVIPALYPLW